MKAVNYRTLVSLFLLLSVALLSLACYDIYSSRLDEMSNIRSRLVELQARRLEVVTRLEDLKKRADVTLYPMKFIRAKEFTDHNNSLKQIIQRSANGVTAEIRSLSSSINSGILETQVSVRIYAEPKSIGPFIDKLERQHQFVIFNTFFVRGVANTDNFMIDADLLFLAPVEADNQA